MEKSNRQIMEERVRQIIERARQDIDFRNQLTGDPAAALKEYDLSPEAYAVFVWPHFRWQVEGKVAGASKPRSAAAFTMLHEAGIGALITLLEEPMAAEELQKYGVEAVHIPVPDYTAPTIEQIEQANVAIDAFLAQGKAVCVHCGAGLGRTGTVLAGYLVSQGVPAAEAIAQVRSRQQGSIETAEQEAVIAQYADVVAERKNK